jgi:glycosyltransferase involved in cell wall biosynthesis
MRGKAPVRVAFVTNIIPPYRKTFYEKLCSTPGIEWLIVRGLVEKEDGRPDFKGKVSFPEARIANREYRLGPYTLRWQRGALGVVRRFRPDVLVVLGIPGTFSNWALCLWARLTGVKVIMWACGWEPQRPGSVALRVKHLVARLYFRMAHRCLLYSTKGATYLRGLGVYADRAQVCYNGIEIDDLQADEPRIRAEALALRERERIGEKRILLYVGAMLDEKRVDMLLDAYAGLGEERRDWVLWLVGDGPARAALERHAARTALEWVRFWGRIIEGVDPYFAAADVFVLPGIGGLAFNQAMFWGTPCIAGEADGTEDDLVVDGQTGKRFVAGDVDSLAAAIRACMHATDSDRARWSQQAREIIISRSNVTAMVKTFIRVIEDVNGAVPQSTVRPT